MKPKINFLRFAIITAVVFAVSAGFASAQSVSPGSGYYDGSEGIIRDISPNTLNIALDDLGNEVTVHTIIPYSQVVGASVKLDGIEIKAYFADSRGYFVAKFDIATVREFVELKKLALFETCDLTLTGTCNDQTKFEDSHPITIINFLPKIK